MARLFFDLVYTSDENALRGTCQKALKRLDSAKIPITGNDKRYTLARIIKMLSGKDLQGQDMVREVISHYLVVKWPVGGRFAALSMLKANFYEYNRGFKEEEVSLTADQIVIALCGAVLSYVGMYKHGDSFYYVYAIPMHGKDLISLVDPLVKKRMDLPPDVGHAVKRLWMSALWKSPYMELVFQSGNRVTLAGLERVHLYEISRYPDLQNALKNTANLLSDVAELAELVASKFQMFYTAYEEVGGMKRRRVEYLLDLLRILRGVLISEASSYAEKKFAEEMLKGISSVVYEETS